MEEVADRLQQAVALSPADATELVWLECFRGEASSRRRRSQPTRQRTLTISVRTLEGGRRGHYQTGADAPGDLAAAVRMAVAHSRSQLRTAVSRQLLVQEETAPADDAAFTDPELAELAPREARSLLQEETEKGESARLRWTWGQVVVANSRGLVRCSRYTGATLAVRTGRRLGAGNAETAARSLRAVLRPEVFERARDRRAEGVEAPAPDLAAPALLLAPEAAGELVRLLGTGPLSAEGFRTGALLAPERLGEEVFAPLLNLRDDGTDATGLPFPFDLEGRAKVPVPLVARGALESPAVDTALAAELGRPVTPHYQAPGETWPNHLFLLPGLAPTTALLEAAAGGLWVGSLGTLRRGAPGDLTFRAVIRSARAVEDGALGQPLPPLVWEDRLDRVFRDVLALGKEPVTRAFDPLHLGGVSAPAMAVAPGGLLTLRQA